MKIFLDTDIGYGTDADDAIALAYLLRHPECDLLGISTVGLHSEWRAAMAEVVCARLGRADMPVAAGADRPLYANQYWLENPVRPWPAEFPRQATRSYAPNEGVDLLRATLRAQPNEVTVITIGQFTNLAMLLLTDPEAAGLAKAVVSMGGAMQYPPDRPKGECNVILDPVAAGIVFQRMEEGLTLLPIEPARGNAMEAEQLAEVFEDDAMDAVRVACAGWKETKGQLRVGLADPLAVSMVFEPELVAVERGRVHLRLFDHHLPDGGAFEGDEVTGATSFEKRSDGPHRVVTGSRGAAARDHVLSILREG
jgi:purine nucleosidase